MIIKLKALAKMSQNTVQVPIKTGVKEWRYVPINKNDLIRAIKESGPNQIEIDDLFEPGWMIWVRTPKTDGSNG